MWTKEGIGEVVVFKDYSQKYVELHRFNMLIVKICLKCMLSCLEHLANVKECSISDCMGCTISFPYNLFKTSLIETTETVLI